MLRGVCSAALLGRGTLSHFVCSSLKALTTCHLSVKGWEDLVHVLNPNVNDEVDALDGDELKELKEVGLSAALLYLFDGAIPLITAFCSEFDRLSRCGPAAEKFKCLLDSKKREKIEDFARCFQVATVCVCVLVMCHCV